MNLFETAGITLYERSQNEFEFEKVGPINVILNNHDPTFPVGSSEDASDSEMTETELLFDE